VSVVLLQAEAASRGARMLRTALGSSIAAWLEEAAVVEVMLNPDGRLWVDRLAGGLADTGQRMSAADGERIIPLVAHHVGAEVHPGSPRVSAELPATGERFEGLQPPIVSGPAFAIRKPTIAIFTLRASDIDLIWRLGYGWPDYRGGPMYFANQMGLEHVVESLEAWATPPDAEVSPLLRQAATTGAPLHRWGWRDQADGSGCGSAGGL